MRRLLPALVVALVAVAVPASGGAGSGGLGKPEVVLTGLDVPWGLAFLPDGSALVAERNSGRILLVQRRAAGPATSRVVMRITGLRAESEAGLLGLAVSPRYRSDRLVYAYYSTARDNRIVRFKLGGPVRPVLTGIPRSPFHNGGRIAFGPDGMLYAGTGDATNGALPQDRRSLGGKILRLRPDGSVPRDNPTRGSPVYSYGHRNVQGLAWDAAGRMYATELGNTRFDELNRILPGRNYGWPGREGRVGEQRPGFTDPLVTWDPNEASPSGVAFVRGSLYVACLRGLRLWRVPLARGRAGRPQTLLEGVFWRLRSAVVAPDGALWLTTSNRDTYSERQMPGDDRLIRIPLRP